VDSLIPKYQDMADMGGNFFGMSILQHEKSIAKLVKDVGATTLLDFGCGRGDAYRSPHKLHHALGLKRCNVTLYDPAFRPSAALPRTRRDIVVCSDVLEHIPEEEVDEFIVRLFCLADKAVWASVCCRPAKKCFPGTFVNMHVTVQPREWWEEKFTRLSAQVDALVFRPPVKWVLVETP
jgi:hypothetical protein